MNISYCANHSPNLRQDDEKHKAYDKLDHSLKLVKCQKYLPFEYQLMEENGKKQIEQCLATAFNHNSSLIFYGCHKLIKINKFENGCVLNEMQELKGHNYLVTCLEYLQNSNELVSASNDNSIIIWNMNEQGQWRIKQKLQQHQKEVNCLHLNQEEDLLISGSDDKTVKFWERKQQNWVCEQIIKTDFCVEGLSLANLTNKLIVCGYDKPEILVISRLDKEWRIIQRIKTNTYGLRLCFINQNMFVFQPNIRECLEIYEVDGQINQFMKKTQVNVKTSDEGASLFFPLQFIPSRNMLFVKNNEYLNIIRIEENGQFSTKQSIDFQTASFFGRVTNNGTHLVTWDDITNQIQIRNFQNVK